MPSQKPTKSRVKYFGEIIGRRALGFVTYKKEGLGEIGGASSLLGGESDISFVMLLEPEKGEILVAERLFTQDPKFYTLHVRKDVV